MDSDLRLESGKDLAIDLPQIPHLTAKRRIARVDLRDVDEIVHQAAQALGVLRQHGKKVTLALREVLRAVLEQKMGVAQNRGDGSAELVRDIRDELVPNAIQFLELLIELRQFANLPRVLQGQCSMIRVELQKLGLFDSRRQTVSRSVQADRPNQPALAISKRTQEV